MKKIFFLFIFCFSIFFLYIFFQRPIVLKLFVGSARNIGTELKSTIYVDGKINTDAKLFKCNSDFYNKEKRNYYILYLRNTSLNDFPVLTIENDENLICYPNASKSDYNIIFGNLIQSESGANVRIPINDEVKGPGINPKLKMIENTIEFELPENGLNKNEKIHKFKINVG